MANFLSLNSGHIAYDLSGSGPLVLCSPSLGDLRAEYRFLTPKLVAAGYSVASMDVRGHGMTSPGWPDYSVAAIGADMLALIEHLQMGPATLIGTSMSGGAGIWAAVENPAAVKALVLIDPFVDGDSNSFLVAILSLLFARPWGVSAWAKYYSSLYPTQKPADFDQYLDDLKANLKQSGRLEAVMAMLKASKQASSQRISQLIQPALILMGSKDPDFPHPVQEGQRLAALLHAPLKIMPDAGHYPHVEMPELAATAILDFMQSL